MNNLSLYEITSGFPKLLENNEILEEEKKEIKKELVGLLNKKSKNIIGYIKNIELTINAMKEEEKRISEQRKILENRLKNFKDYVKDCMEFNGITKVETALGNLSIARSPISVEIENENLVPQEFKIITTTSKIDKSKIKDNFKETGEIPTGVKINTENTNLRIN